MIRFNDLEGNSWTFIKNNISLIHTSQPDQEGISRVSVTTIDGTSYSFKVNCNEENWVSECG